MRFMIIVKASPESEQAGALPSADELREMGEFNESLVNAGVMRAGEGLHPSSAGARVRYGKGAPVVTDGPFPEAKELVAGFWILELESMDEAKAWARKIPFRDGEVEIRRVFETEEFAPADPTGELRAAEHKLRERVEEQQKK